MRRVGFVMLLIAVAGAGGVVTFGLSRTVLSAAAQQDAPPAWQGLDAPRRQAFVQRYRALRVQPDGQQVLHDAREFQQLPPPQRQDLRQVQRELEHLIANLTAPERRTLLRLPGRARATELYRRFAREHPARLAELRARLTAAP